MQRNSNLSSIVTFLFAGLILFAPFVIIAQTPPAEPSSVFVVCEGADCDFEDLVRLVNNIITWIINISIPIATIAFAYAGFLYLWSGDSTSKVEKAKDIFKNVGLGLIIMLSAYVIVRTIMVALFNDTGYVNFF